MLKTDAVVFDGELKFVKGYEIPDARPGEALIRPTLLGICNTDEEITRGYMNYNGVLGHEFVGIAESAPENPELTGKRVVGGINIGCKNCPECASGLERHCKNRQTLGIFHKDGCFSRLFTLPVSNLLAVPDNVPDEVAVFIEPLAAAYEILEQIQIKPHDRVAVLGDGKLGLCVSAIFSALNIDFIQIGKHGKKLEITRRMGGKTMLLSQITDADLKSYDIAVEATGSIGGFKTSLSLVRPRGTLVLKSTIAAKEGLNFASLVVNEITVVGSRCGQFAPVLRLMEKRKIDTAPFISKILPFNEALSGFKLNRRKDTVKILLKP